MHIPFTAVFVTVFLSATATAQTAPPPEEPMAPVGETWGLDPLLFQPGTHVYFDDPPDPGEINPFPLSVDLQWVGIDVVKYLRKGRLRTGATFSFASIGANANSAAGAITYAWFVQIGQHSRLNFGGIYVTSLQHEGGSRDKHAGFIGMSFPTKLTDALR